MKANLKELLLQALETESGGVDIYETALGCVQNGDLQKEWQEYLDQTRQHVSILKTVFEKLGIDLNEQSPGRKVVSHIGKSLVKAMEMAKSEADPAAAELTACECVVLAETKDHSNWELIAEYVKQNSGEEAKILKSAVEEVEEQEDEHVYHSKGWGRELWIKSLGMDAVLPPPEEEKNVKTAIGASRAQQKRESML